LKRNLNISNRPAQPYVSIIGAFMIMCFWLGGSLSAQISWQWAENINRPSNEFCRDISVNSANGDNYTVGAFDGNLVPIFPNGINNTPNMNSSGIQDGFVAKRDSWCYL